MSSYDRADSFLKRVFKMHEKSLVFERYKKKKSKESPRRILRNAGAFSDIQTMPPGNRFVLGKA